MSRDWIDYINAFGSLGTVGAFIYLFYQQHLNSNQQHRTEVENDNQREKSNIQQFESSFFNLLKLHSDIVIHLRYHESASLFTDERSIYGRSVFNEAKSSLRRLCLMYKTSEELDVTDTIEAKERLSTKYYDTYYKAFETVLNHYFRNLYHIYKYIDESQLIAEPLKSRYASIVRAQLSQNELYVILFNMMFDGYGYPKFIRYDIKYNILKNFRRPEDLSPFMDLYNQIKFDFKAGSRDCGINIQTHRFNGIT